MSTFFDHLGSLLYKKDLNNPDINGDSDFQPYLLTRYISLYSNDLCIYMNETVNKRMSIFDDKQMYHDFIDCIIPKMRFKKIEYIKKVKKEKQKEDNNEILAKRLEISQKEIYNYSKLIKEINNE
jgi:hypothetical protein